MKAKNLLARALSGLGALLAVAIAGFFAEPAVFEEEAEEATPQPEVAAGAEAAGGAMIDTSSWDELSKRVIPKIVDNNLDFGTLLLYARKASCTVYMVVRTPQIAMPELGSFTVPPGPPSTARISLSWEDANDDGTIAEDEVKIETGYTSDIAVKMAMERVHKGLKSLVTLNVINLLTQAAVKAERKGQGYEITVNPKKGPPVPVRLTVSNDFRITSTQTRSLEGSDVVNNLKHTRTGGKWLVTGAETTSGAGTDFTSTDKWGNEYVIQDGIPLLTKATIASTSSTGGGVLQTHQEYSFRDWQIEKRAEPLEVVVEPTKVEEPRVEPTRVQKTRAKTPRTVVRPAQKARAPQVRILRTEQAKKLANDTIVSVGSAYYDIAAAGVKGYEASFTVEVDGEPVGSFNLKWEAFGGVSVEPDLADDEAKGFVEALGQQIGRVFAGGPLSDYSFAADAYAAKSGNKTVIDATAHASATDPNVKSDLVYVSPDLRQVRTTRTVNDGKTAETVYAGEEVEGKLFVSSATQTSREPGGTPEKTEYTWTYAKKEGVPFIKRLEWSGTVGEQTGDWTVVLENVTFEKEVARIRIDRGAREAARLAQETKIPQTEEANKLARSIFKSVGDKYHTLQSEGVFSFVANFGVELDGEPAGTLTVGWIDGKGIPIGTVKGAPDKRTKAFAEAMGSTIFMPLTGAIISGVKRPDNAYAVKSGDQYVMEVSGKSPDYAPNLKLSRNIVSADFSQIRIVSIQKDGMVIDTVFHEQPRRGKSLVGSSTQTSEHTGEDTVKLNYRWTYAPQEGSIFIKKVEIDKTIRNQTTRWIAALRDVTFERGARPAGEEARRAAAQKIEQLKKLLQDATVPRTEEARKLAREVSMSAMKSYYTLWSTDVAGFDASFSMELQGEPMGTLKARWHRPDTDPTVTLEGVEEKAKKLAELFSGLEFRALMQPPVTAGPEVYAMKWGDDYVMDASEALRKELPESQGGIMSISADLTEVLVVNVVEGGDVLESVYRGQPADGKTFMSSAVETIGGEPPITQEFLWTYAQKEGVQFIEKVIVYQSIGTSGTVQWTLTVKNVTFERGAEPVDFQKAQEEQENARRGVEEAEKELGETINQLLEKEREKWLGRDKQEGEEEKQE